MITTQIPYLRASELHTRMLARPRRPFFVSPSDYTVVDGDTLRILSAKTDKAPCGEAFRIRLDGIDAPERPIVHPSDRALQSIGIDPHEGHPGRMATSMMRDFFRNRAIYVEPVAQGNGRVTDRYERLVGRVYVSGSPGPVFDVHGARSAENHLFDIGMGVIMKDSRLPPRRSAVLEGIENDAVRRDFAPDPSP